MSAEPLAGGAPGPLNGLLVADFSRVLAGPLATMFLGDLGATVVKVERPGHGDDTRRWGPPFAAGESTYFLSVNRNKRSVVLDLSSAPGLRHARLLAARADVLVENFRPGRLGQLGLGYPEVSAGNPGLVYCSISGFGTGAGAALAGYDFVAQAVGGLMSVTGTPEAPTKVGVALVDVLTGLHAAVGILAALRRRDETGQGQQVEVNLLSSLLSSLVNQASGYLNGGGVPGAMGNRHPSIVPYETLRARDGYVAVAVGNDGQFGALCGVLGLGALAADRRFATNPARVANHDALSAALESALASADVDEWVSRLRRADIACGPVNDLAGAFADAAALGLAPTVDFAPPGSAGPAESPGSADPTESPGSAGSGGPPLRTVASPLHLTGTPPSYRRPPPRLGADTEEVLAWLDGPPGTPAPPG